MSPQMAEILEAQAPLLLAVGPAGPPGHHLAGWVGYRHGGGDGPRGKLRCFFVGKLRKGGVLK